MRDNAVVSESEIMKGLEDCAKLGFKLNGYAFELIKQKNAKIEELEKGVTIHVKIKDPTVYEYLFKTIRTETIREFEARLKGIFGFDELNGVVIRQHIDNIVKEMEE